MPRSSIQVTRILFPEWLIRSDPLNRPRMVKKLTSPSGISKTSVFNGEECIEGTSFLSFWWRWIQRARTRETIVGCGIRSTALSLLDGNQKGNWGTGGGEIQKWISVMKPDYSERCPLGKLHIIFFIPLIFGAPSPYRLCYSYALAHSINGIFQEPFPLGLLRSFQGFPKRFPFYRTYGE